MTYFNGTHIYTQTHTHTERERETHTQIHKHTRTHTQTRTHTHTYTQATGVAPAVGALDPAASSGLLATTNAGGDTGNTTRGTDAGAVLALGTDTVEGAKRREGMRYMHTAVYMLHEVCMLRRVSLAALFSMHISCVYAT